MTKKSIALAVSSLSIALAACACFMGCKAKEAQAPRADVQAISDGTNLRVARSFPPRSIRIGSGGNKFFLWKLKTVEECPARLTLPIPGASNPGGPTRPKLGPCPDDVAFVLNTSNKPVNGLIALDDRTFLIQSEENSIRRDVLSKSIRNSADRVLSVEDLINLIDVELPKVPQYTQARDTATAQQTTAKTQRDQKKAALDAEVAKPQAEQDPNLIAQLNRDIAALDTKIQNFQRRIDQFNAQITDATRAPQQVADNTLDGALEEFRKKVKERDEISAESDALLNKVKEAVDFYDYSDNLTVAFTFEENGSIGKSMGLQGISVEVQNWDFRVAGPDGPVGEEGEKSFSTSDGTITGVSYVELGGTFEFDVHAADARYHFKVSRTRYGSSDGLAHFNGDILRYSNDGSDRGNPRRGVAVMDEPNLAASQR
jgi:hypothetical protein